ncbi:multidrug effflux MFS transporter [Lactiplantibacillus daowaiensis]|uniref:Bcr/CflA family efflux transporter n=1 Tax=Lactiplantibacillus daowaiensis TaxID=2559918 RepID=A0ABW1S1B8_9LACO|nr:multidrug effflux MFS transporter [Lactiplantibacillus daowaiensis]
MKNVQKQVPSLMLIITLVGFPQISESIFTPVLPALSRALQVSASQIQLTMSSYFIAFAIGVLVWGQLADYWGRRPAMLAGIVIYLIGNLGLYLSPNFTWLLGFRLVQAFGASAGSVVTQTIMRESFSGVTGAKIFAQTSAAMALSPALGPLLGGLVQSLFGYRQVFSTLIAMAVLVLLYSGWRLPETRQLTAVTARPNQWQVIKRLWHDPVVWVYGILIGGINGILFSYYAEAPFIFETHFGFAAWQYGLLGLVLAAASLLGALLVNHLLNRYQPEQLVLAGLGLSVLASLCLVSFAWVNQAGAMLVGIFGAFLGLNITLPNALNRALVGYEGIMGSASGWFSLAYYVIVSGLTYLMSWLHQGSIVTLPVYMLGLCVIMLGSYFWLYQAKLK